MLTRRNFLKLSLLTAANLALNCRSINYNSELKLRKEKVISDPDVFNKISELIKKWKENDISGYADEEVYEPYLEANLEIREYLRSQDIADPNFLRDYDLIPDYLVEKDAKADKIFFESQDEDTFEDISDLEEYVKENIISFNDVLSAINNSRVALFGEIHDEEKHHELEERLLEQSNKKDLAYTFEPLILRKIREIQRFMDGDDEILSVIFYTMFGMGRNMRFLKRLREKQIPVIPVDIVEFLRESYGGKRREIFELVDPRAIYYLREKIFASQIGYAYQNGFRVLGHFGDAHLRAKHLPAILDDDFGIEPLIISGADFTKEDYDVVMKVTNGKDVFVRRNNRILYFTSEGGKSPFIRKRKTEQK